MKPTNNKIELLAPAGRWDAFTAVIDAGADAVYIGGKKFNMRLHRSDFNFTDEQITEAVEYAHSRNVKLYITVNNLLGNEELKILTDYLAFLEKIRVDALIVQDLGVLHAIQNIGVSIPIHISTMMNIHNVESALTLKEQGVKRIVTSRDIPLSLVKEIHEKADIEVEYFIHGDLCICQSGQCYSSGVLFGKSANRGECMKPCRWQYTVVESNSGQTIGNLPSGYLLAIKDMCLLKHIPDLIHAGVCSFKIEGRMRHADYLREIVGIYRNAIDTYREDPMAYYMHSASYEQLYQSRVREFTTAMSFTPSSVSLVDISGEREPLFLSRAAKERSLTNEDIYDNPFETAEPYSMENEITAIPQLSVKVGSMDSLITALEEGADQIIVNAESSQLGKRVWTKSLLKEARDRAKDAGKIIRFGTPRITTALEMNDVQWLYEQAVLLEVDDVLIHNLGTLRIAKEYGLQPFADYSLNILNSAAMKFLEEAGICGATASLECSYSHLKQLAENAVVPVECVAHGPVTGMILEHCIPAMLTSKSHKKDHCRQVCQYMGYALKDERGEIRPIETDQYCRNHILLARDICVLPYLHSFVKTKVKILRIEAQFYETAFTKIAVGLYRKYLDILLEHPKLSMPVSEKDWDALLKNSPRECNPGSYVKDITHSKSTAEVMKSNK
ncbi:MAG: U32 family peptidase [Candidatus Kuenenia sp.]|nr:U32 family peptidase [Candidatus Kuenenia hertensis]